VPNDSAFGFGNRVPERPHVDALWVDDGRLVGRDELHQAELGVECIFGNELGVESHERRNAQAIADGF
jgi:hypothetical protein